MGALFEEADVTFVQPPTDLLPANKGITLVSLFGTSVQAREIIPGGGAEPCARAALCDHHRLARAERLSHTLPRTADAAPAVQRHPATQPP